MPIRMSNSTRWRIVQAEGQCLATTLAALVPTLTRWMPLLPITRFTGQQSAYGRCSGRMPTTKKPLVAALRTAVDFRPCRNGDCHAALGAKPTGLSAFHRSSRYGGRGGWGIEGTGLFRRADERRHRGAGDERLPSVSETQRLPSAID